MSLLVWWGDGSSSRQGGGRACRAAASHGHPWRASAPGPGERGWAHAIEAGQGSLVLRAFGFKERSQGRALILGPLRALWWPCLRELEREECCFPFHSTGAHPTCLVWRAANCWGGLAFRESMLRFKGERKIVLVVVGVKIFPHRTGIARLWFGPSTFWLYCLISAACRGVSRLRVSVIFADFSHTCPELCFKHNPTPACLFAVLPHSPTCPGNAVPGRELFPAPSCAQSPASGRALHICVQDMPAPK